MALRSSGLGIIRSSQRKSLNNHVNPGNSRKAAFLVLRFAMIETLVSSSP